MIAIEPKQRNHWSGIYTSHFVALVVIAPCVVSLSMGEASNILSAEGAFATINLLIAVILLATFFYHANHTLAFVHIVAIWLMLICTQFAQLGAGTIREGGSFYLQYNRSQIIVANFAIALWLIVFAASYLLTYRRFSARQEKVAALSFRSLVMACVLSYAALVYLYWRLGGIITTRAAFEEAIDTDSSLETALVVYPLRALPYYALGAFILAYQTVRAGWRRHLMVMAGIGLGVGALVMNNPLAAPRFFSGVVAFGLLYLAMLRKANSNVPLLLIIVLSVCGFLALDYGRHALTFEEAAAQVEWSAEKVFLNDTIGTFESVLASVAFIEAHGTTLGWQFFGNLLFFIPRFIWPEKPIGSGAFITETEFGANVFSNLSCAAPCEGLINFGLPGVLFLAVLFGVVLARWDKKHAELRTYWGRTAVFSLFYAFVIGHVFFITRGDFLSPLAFMVSMSFAYWLIRGFTKAEHAANAARGITTENS